MRFPKWNSFGHFSPIGWTAFPYPLVPWEAFLFMLFVVDCLVYSGGFNYFQSSHSPEPILHHLSQKVFVAAALHVNCSDMLCLVRWTFAANDATAAQYAALVIQRCAIRWWRFEGTCVIGLRLMPLLFFLVCRQKLSATRFAHVITCGHVVFVF